MIRGWNLIRVPGLWVRGNYYQGSPLASLEQLPKKRNEGTEGRRKRERNSPKGSSVWCPQSHLRLPRKRQLSCQLANQGSLLPETMVIWTWKHLCISVKVRSGRNKDGSQQGFQCVFFFYRALGILMGWATERQVGGDHYFNQCSDTFTFLTSSLSYNSLST